MSNFKVKGEYVITKGKSPEKMDVVAKFENLITDVGLQAISTNNLTAFCYVGTGNTPPVYADTSMNNHIFSQGLTSTESAAHIITPERHTRQGFRYRLTPGNGTGNIAEVGVGSTTYTNVNRVLFSRALILDEDDNPTIITKLEDDYLDIYYYVSIYMNTEDVVQEILYKDVPTTWRSRPSNIQNFGPSNMITAAWGNSTTVRIGDANATIGDITGTPSSHFVQNVSATWQTKTAGTTYRDLVMNIPFSAVSPTGSIGTEQLVFSAGTRNGGSYQSSFTPPLTKSNEEQLTLTFRVSWGRR